MIEMVENIKQLKSPTQTAAQHFNCWFRILYKKKSELQTLHNQYQLHGLLLRTRTRAVLSSSVFQMLRHLAVSEYGSVRLVSSQLTLPVLKSRATWIDNRATSFLIALSPSTTRGWPLRWPPPRGQKPIFRQKSNRWSTTVSLPVCPHDGSCLESGRLSKSTCVKVQQMTIAFRQWTHIAAPLLLYQSTCPLTESLTIPKKGLDNFHEKLLIELETLLQVCPGETTRDTPASPVSFVFSWCVAGRYLANREALSRLRP